MTEGFSLAIHSIEKNFDQVKVLKKIEMTIRAGEFVAIVGHSGSGKSTLLRLIAGLEESDEGEILIDQKKVQGINPQVRYLFQEPRLLPWKTVAANVQLGTEEQDSRVVLDTLEKIGLADKKDIYPDKLSGGQKQRVSLARALIGQPRILLLDEPLGALDALTRMEMQNLIESIWVEQRFTAVLVTHDVEEAVTLADRVFIIEDGIVIEVVEITLSRPRIVSNDKTYFTNAILKKILRKNQPDPAEDYVI